MKLGIIGAVKEEVELLVEALQKTDSKSIKIKKGSLFFYEGVLDTCQVVIVCCGVGKVNAALCAQILISEFGVQAILNTGAAGGLDARLKVLDLVVSTDAVQHDMDASWFGYAKGQVPGMESAFYVADERLCSIAQKAFTRVIQKNTDTNKPSMIKGRIASGDIFVSSKEKRKELLKEFSPACVEMEGASIAQVCTVNAIPFVILRSISDLAGDDAGISYEDFSVKASHTSALVVQEMLFELGGL